MRSDLPTGAVTFLFTDVEGSTRLLHALGPEAYAEALAEHRGVIRDACTTHGGIEIDTQGDAFFFAFPNATGALAAAGDLTDGLLSRPIRVRAGLHTGTPLVTDVGYVGDDVHVAARIAAAAHGGQVVLSAATAALVGAHGGTSPMPVLVELGEHRLKDIPQAVSILQLGEEAFPPLRTISNTNVPRPVSSFVGRGVERAQVVGTIRAGARLVTLTGSGGSGKTRLAIEAAAALLEDFMAGVFWVNLAPIRDPALVTATIAQALGASEGLAQHVGERELLLLLDNLEQVVECVPELASLLERCPNLVLLVTSREVLRLRGEVEYPVPPLASSDAVALFCERSGLEPGADITELCARLDDLPLAVELAAARTRALTPAQILERLATRLDLLEGGRDADPRQQTLRATIAWSHDLLAPSEQRLFRRVSVFVGGCTLAAAEGVCEADLDGVQSLVEKSLLRFTGGRYWTLETIREYAAERLVECGEDDEFRLRHGEWYRDDVREGAMEWFGGKRAPGWEEKVNAEHDNVRAALEALHARGRDDDVARLIVAVGGHWDASGFGRECDHWLDIALDAVEEARLRVRLLGLAARRASFRNDGDAALELAVEFAALAEEIGEPLALASATFTLARAHEVAGDIESATEEYARSAELFRGRNDASEAAALANVVGLEIVRGEYGAAREHALAARELAVRAGYTEAIIGNTIHVAAAYLREGETAEASTWLRRAFVAVREHELVTFVADELILAAELAVLEGLTPNAAILVGAARNVSEVAAIELANDSGARADGVEQQAVGELGEVAVAGLVARGAALTWQEAVALALDSLDGRSA